MRWVRWFVREWMIGWHQGHKERRYASARKHEAAENRWRESEVTRERLASAWDEGWAARAQSRMPRLSLDHLANPYLVGIEPTESFEPPTMALPALPAETFRCRRCGHRVLSHGHGPSECLECECDGFTP